MQYVNLDTSLTRRWQRVKDFVNYTKDSDFWLDVNQHIRGLVKDLIQFSLEEEMIDYQKRQSYQRSNSILDYRNGYYYRNLDTAVGPIELIQVPRSRSGLFHPKVFLRYQRRQEIVQ